MKPTLVEAVPAGWPLFAPGWLRIPLDGLLPHGLHISADTCLLILTKDARLA